MALLSKKICWNIGSDLTASFTVSEGNIVDTDSSSATFTQNGNSITFSPLYGSINGVGGFHINGSSLDPSTGKVTTLWMDGDVNDETGESGNGAYTISYPDGSSVSHPPRNSGQPPQWLTITSC